MKTYPFIMILLQMFHNCPLCMSQHWSVDCMNISSLYCSISNEKWEKIFNLYHYVCIGSLSGISYFLTYSMTDMTFNWTVDEWRSMWIARPFTWRWHWTIKCSYNSKTNWICGLTVPVWIDGLDLPVWIDGLEIAAVFRVVRLKKCENWTGVEVITLGFRHWLIRYLSLYVK